MNGHVFLRDVAPHDLPRIYEFQLDPESNRMAVLPEIQRPGIGSALVEIGVEACRNLPYTSIVVFGHPDFYPRFGF